jgi:hypothetical protein
LKNYIYNKHNKLICRMYSHELKKIENISKSSYITLKNSNLSIDLTKYTYSVIKLQSSGSIKLQKFKIKL